ncbi:MFS transporter [Novisyntrophococcus fermenticellae]|uniref:MFS transporter n=1 Tax=Novisyntrophococcus fermenticellae TaxID=2068655 RepID=UPI001E544D48|nr:MFS transporter [Novisyntrophococcus fermenticellae]
MSNNEKKKSALIVMAMTFLVLFIGNYGQFQFAALPMDIFLKLGLTADTQFTSLMTAPMIAAILLGILSGALADRFGIKLVVGVANIVTVVGMIIRPLAHIFGLMFIGMILMGVGCAATSSNLSKILASVVSVDKVSKYMGIVLLGSTLSMAVCFSTSSLFPSLDAALWTIAAVSVLISILWFILVRKKDFQNNDLPEIEKVKMSVSFKKAFKSKNVWFMGLVLAFVLAANIINQSFLVLALTGRGYSTAMAGYINTIMTIGSIVGTLTGPIIVFKLKSQKPALVFMGIVAIIGVAFAWQLTTVAMCIVLFLEGYCLSAIITITMIYPVALKEIGPIYAGSAGGMASTIQLLGAVCLPTYVIVPVANLLGSIGYSYYFYLGAVSMLIAIFFMILLPDMNKLMKAE